MYSPVQTGGYVSINTTNKKKWGVTLLHMCPTHLHHNKTQLLTAK